MIELTYDVPIYHGTLYEAVYQSSQDLQNIIQEVSKQYPEFNRFSKELFSRIYGLNTIKAQNTPYWYQWAADLHTCIDEVEEMSSLHRKAERDPIKAALATLEILKAVVPKLPEVKLDNLQDIDKALEAIDELEDEFKEYMQREVNESSVKKAQERLEAKQEAGREKAAGVKISHEEMRAAIRGSVEDLNENMEKFEMLVEVPGTLEERLKHDSTREYLKAFKRAQYDKELMKFFDLCGNLENSYAREKQNIETYSRKESSDIVLGSDLSRALLVEHMDDDLFDLKFINDELMMRGVKSKEPKEKGDVVVCVDFSGSMSCENRDTIAKAIVVALYGRMRKEHRKFAACLFNGGVIYEFSHDRGNVMEFVEFTPSGGTRIEPAFQWAETKITPDADVVIITDGGFYVANPEHWRTKFNKCNILSVLIGGSVESLAALSDKVIETNDLMFSSNEIFRFIQ